MAELTDVVVPNVEAGLKSASFPQACREFFGIRQNGEGLKGFAAELKALDQVDRAELKLLFRNVGYDIHD